MERKIAVTGSKGFIGSILCKLLEIPKARQFDLPDGDIRKRAVRERIADSADVIIHLAGISGVKDCDKEPAGAMETNCEAALALYREFGNRAKDSFIFASSSAVYGETEKLQIDESHETSPRSVYGITKLMAEQKMLEEKHERQFLTKLIILRKSNVFGYGMFWKGTTVPDRFIEKYLLRGSMGVMGNGTQMRDFLHIMDAVRTYATIARSKIVRSGIYNIGGNDRLSILGLADLVNDIGESILGYKVPVEVIEGNPGARGREFNYDYGKAKMEFGYEPRFQLDDYVKERILLALRSEK